MAVRNKESTQQKLVESVSSNIRRGIQIAIQTNTWKLGPNKSVFLNIFKDNLNVFFSLNFII